MKKIISIILIVVVLVVGAVGFSAYSDINGSKGEGQAVTITVPKGSGSSTVAKILAENKIISNQFYFKIYTKINPVENLHYGDFELNTNMSYQQIIETLGQSTEKRQGVKVTFPEGFSLIQFAQRMENNGLCTAEEFIQVANNEDFSQFEFWKKIKEHDNKFMKAEGYLYPDTYEFFEDDTVYNMVAKIFGTFDSKITQEMYDRMDEIGMSLDDVVTLASFVQEEAGNPKDQPYVAACLSNRLKPDGLVNRLECNVSSSYNEKGNYVYDYIVPYYGGVNKVPAGMMNAYNTYAVQGLPPSPISNPGIDAIVNSLWPAENFEDYYFFVTDLNGKYYYGKTANEHNANVKQALAVNKTLGVDGFFRDDK